MRIIIKIRAKDRAKAWDILVRHSPGTALPECTFIVSGEAIKALRLAGVKFKEIAREPGRPASSGVITGERI
jgi:hypothetical protein